MLVLCLLRCCCCCCRRRVVRVGGDERRRAHPYVNHSRQLQVPMRQHAVAGMPLVNMSVFGSPLFAPVGWVIFNSTFLSLLLWLSFGVLLHPVFTVWNCHFMFVSAHQVYTNVALVSTYLHVNVFSLWQLIVPVLKCDTVTDVMHFCGCSLTSMSSFGFPAGGGGNFVSTSSSTKIVNGKRIVTKK